jgi:hypothetical protein
MTTQARKRTKAGRRFFCEIVRGITAYNLFGGRRKKLCDIVTKKENLSQH